MDEKKTETANQDKAVGANVLEGEIVLPGEAAALAKVEPSAMERIDLTTTIPARAFSLDAAAIEVIRELKCPGATKTEVAWFLYQCHALGLNPLLPGQISFAAYDSGDDGDGGKERRRVIMVEIGGMRVLAMRSQRYRQGDPPALEYDDDGRQAAVTVSLFRREDNVWVRHERRFLWTEFAAFHNKRGWRKMPTIMFAKAAEAALIRFYFPDGCAGVYTPEEIEAPDISDQTATKPAAPKASIYEQAHGLLAVAAKKFRDLGAAKPKDAAAALGHKAVPGKPSTETWTQADLDAFRAEVDKIDQPPPADTGKGGPDAG